MARMIVGSIDGDVEFALHEIKAGVGTDWSDDGPMHVWLDPDPTGDIRIGSADPATGDVLFDRERVEAVVEALLNQSDWPDGFIQRAMQLVVDRRTGEALDMLAEREGSSYVSEVVGLLEYAA